MPLTADKVINLAESINSLSETQLRRIKDVATFMNEEDLGKLEKMLKDLREKELEKARENEELKKRLASAYAEWKSDRARERNKKAELADRALEEKEAEALIENL